jgi:uncharacterized membrane protein YgdD (TMEM256/DUF423 family)
MGVAVDAFAWPDGHMTRNTMTARPAALLVAAALVGAVGVLAAAFGAHGLEKIAGPAEVRFWAIGAAIQLVTAPALFSASLHAERVRPVVGWLWVTGVVLFSGSLYAMALGGPRALGAVTPLGGLALTLGWLGLLLPGSASSR